MFNMLGLEEVYLGLDFSFFSFVIFLFFVFCLLDGEDVNSVFFERLFVRIGLIYIKYLELYLLNFSF